MLLKKTKQILAANLTRLMENRTEPRIELAKRIGIGDGTLGRIKYGQGNPTVAMLVQIANFFRREPSELLLPNLGEASNRVAEPSTPYNALNEHALSSAFELVYRVLDTEDLTLPRSKFIRAVILVYERLIQDDEKVQSADVLEFIRRIA